MSVDSASLVVEVSVVAVVDVILVVLVVVEALAVVETIGVIVGTSVAEHPAALAASHLALILKMDL